MKDLKEMSLRELVDTREFYADDIVDELERRLPEIEAAVEGMECIGAYQAAQNTTEGIRLWENVLDAEATYRAAKEAERNA